jgi:hypothetical protein
MTDCASLVFCMYETRACGNGQWRMRAREVAIEWLATQVACMHICVVHSDRSR